MTREEAIEQLNNVRDLISEEAIDMAIEALEQTRWIPVSERLPQDSDYYLVTTSWGDVEQIWFAHKKDYDITESEWREDDDNPVAWMPLPEPYRGDDHEE